MGLYNSGIFEAQGYHLLLLHIWPGCDVQDKVAHLLPMSVRRERGEARYKEWGYITVRYI